MTWNPPLAFDAGRRHLLAAALLATALPPARAATYPDKPIRIVVPFTAGSATDTAGRVLASGLADRLGVAVVIDNKAGAGGVIGSASVAQAAPDGHTLVLTSSSTHSAAGALVSKVPYDGTEDFVHIVRIATIPLALVVRQESKAGSVAGLQELARQQLLNYAYGSAASQIAASTFAGLAGIKALGVPYRSQPPAVTDLLGGQVDFLFADLSVVKAFIDSGRLRALAVSAPERVQALPGVATLRELGFSHFDLVVWVGLAAPRGTPAAIIERLSSEAVAVLREPTVVARLSGAGMDVSPNSLQEQRLFAVEQKRAWMARAAAAGVVPQ